MGIDWHGLRFLQYAAGKGPFGATATLGRQALDVSDAAMRAALRLPDGKRYDRFCEAFLVENFGSTTVTSFDIADYEQASVIHDFSRPLIHERTYDTVIDLGTLEHIFDVAVALRNIVSLSKLGGHIIHALPGNNYSGHGFWQFSPELFFSLYSEQNGFAGTEVFVAELNDNRSWWRAQVPKNGGRVEYTSCNRSYILVITRRQAAVDIHDVVQSDYRFNWALGRGYSEPLPGWFRVRLNRALGRIPFAWRWADSLCPLPSPHADARLHRLRAAHPHFTKVPIASLIASAAVA